MSNISTFGIAFLIISFFFIALPEKGFPQPPLCLLNVCKDAGPNSEGIPFPFEEEINGLVEPFELESGSECHETFFDADNNTTVTEGFTPGFVLDRVNCVAIQPGITITEVNGGIEAQCNLQGGSDTCTFVNVQNIQAVTAVPTLSEWGLITMAGVLGIIGYLVILRKKVTFRA